MSAASEGEGGNGGVLRIRHTRSLLPSEFAVVARVSTSDLRQNSVREWRDIENGLTDAVEIRFSVRLN
jgi:hypothetical protein